MVRVITFTRNRALYFQQTFNSLLFSLEGDNTIPITIVLNDADEETTALARKYQDKRANVEVLSCDRNCIFAGPTVAINWYQPQEICIVQDDHILPPLTRAFYPYWPYRFKELLDQSYDVVYMPCHMHNLPTHINFPYYLPTREDDLFSYYDDVLNKPPTFLCQPCMMKTAFWRSCYNPQSKTAMDSIILSKAKRMAHTRKALTTHIGWHRDMDGLTTTEDWAVGFNLPFDSVNVTSLRTGETREIQL